MTALIPAAGLRSDVSKLAARPGSMRRASNVVIEAGGVAASRPSFNVETTKAGDFRPRSMHAFGAEIIMACHDGADWQLESDTGVISGTIEPLDEATSPPQFAEMRLGLYVTRAKGPAKLTNSSDTALESAGMHEAPQGEIALSAVSNWLPNGDLVAYRWLFEKTDANNVVVRSAPSPWTFLGNTSGSAKSIDATVVLPPYAAAGDIVVLYRSKKVSAGTPSDEMFLVTRYTLVSGDVSAGQTTINDVLTEDRLGEALYTNPSRESIRGANVRPPACVAIAAFASCMWFGNVKLTHTLIVDLVTLGTWYGTFTGDTSVGSNSITSPSSTTNLRVGQIIENANFPAGTKITAIGAAVTVSQNATGTAVGTTITFRDVITVDAVEYYPGASTNVSLRIFGVSTAALPGPLAYETARTLARVVSQHSSAIYAVSFEDTTVAAATRTGRIIFRSVELDDASFSFTTTTPAAAFQYPAGTSSEAERKPHRVYYSKPYEPEHTTLLGYIDIGDERQPILRMTALENGLLVWKGDGVFVVSGSAPSSWRLDRLDSSRLLRAEAVDVMDDRAFALTDRGVVVASGAGIESNLTEGVISRELSAYTSLLDSDGATRGAFVACWPTRGLVLVGVPGATQAVNSTRVYCWARESAAWSSWEIEIHALAFSTYANSLFASLAGAWRLAAAVDGRGYDVTHALSGWTYTAGTTTISISDAQRGAWTPEAGDWVSAVIGDPTYHRRVLAAVDAGASYTLTIDEAFPSGAQSGHTAYEGAPVVLEWMPSNPTAAVGRIVRELHAHLDVSARLDAEDPVGTKMRVTGGAQSDVTGLSTVTGTPSYASILSRPVRIGMPRAVARNAHLYPYLSLNELHYPLRCMGIALIGDAVSEKTRR